MKAKSFEKPTLAQAVGLALLIEATGVTITVFLWKLVGRLTL
jgi:hypothetical protein